MTKKIMLYGIHEITWGWRKSQPPQLFIGGRGVARTGGWSNAQLVPMVPVTRPEDGLQDFELVATPPTGESHTSMALDTTLSFDFAVSVADLPPWVRGFRVRTETDVIEEHFLTLSISNNSTVSDINPGEPSLGIEQLLGGTWPFPGNVERIESGTRRLRPS